jgi:hypothetical protein
MHANFRRVRVEVLDLGSGVPVTNPRVIQQMVQSHSSWEVRFPNVRAVEPTSGVWDIYLPEDVVREFGRLGETHFELEAANRYFRVRLLAED